jgi:hypothetical protein
MESCGHVIGWLQRGEVLSAPITNYKHRKIVGIYLITHALISLVPAEVHSHVCNTLIASIITFRWMDRQKMPLESYFQEARELLAATLVSMLDAAFLSQI